MPPGAQHPRQFRHRRHVIRDVLEHLGSDDAIERGVGERQRQRIPLHRGRRVVGRQLPRLHHRSQSGAHLRHFIGSRIERDDRRTTPGRLERVPAEPAAEIQEEVPRLHPELVVVHGQHATSPPGATVGDCRHRGGERTGRTGQRLSGQQGADNRPQCPLPSLPT